MKYPYGLSDFRTLMRDGYFFDDKTGYITLIENFGSRYHFLLRPRRFGKSLFVSMLHYYYGLEHKENFLENFGATWIGQNPTPLAGAYRVLKLEFSRIDTRTPESTEAGFLRNIRDGADVFLNNYGMADGPARAEILAHTTPAGMASALFSACKKAGGAPVFVLIDEYDHFANEIMAFDFKSYTGMVSGNGFVRKFYESIKAATGDGVVGRMFATGVTPITLDSLTSGFNIASDLTRDVRLNEAMGFSEKTVDMMLENSGVPNAKSVVGEMRGWYNGYRFSPKAKETVYNPDMCLYFLECLAGTGEYPENIVDPNIATDYGKMARLFNLLTPAENFAVLEHIMANGAIAEKLTARYSFERPFERGDFVSMLYYMGFLTIKGTELDATVFAVPNYAIKTLYWGFAAAKLRERAEMEPRMWDARGAVTALAMQADHGPLFAKVGEVLKALSVRDALNFNEKAIKMVIVALIMTTDIYYIKSESEAGKGFADVMLMNRPPVFPAWQFAFELKYLKKGATKAARLEAMKEARGQLKTYWQSPEWQKEPNLRTYAAVFVYDELWKVEEVERG